MIGQSEQLRQGMPLGTLTFLSGGQYFGLDVRSGAVADSVSLRGVASSFIHTRQVTAELSGKMVVFARRRAPQLAEAMGTIWELSGSVGGLAPFPFLECESVPLPGTPGALVRVMSEWGEHRCLHLTGCPDQATTAWLTACMVVAVPLLDSVSGTAEPDVPGPLTADAVISVLGGAGNDLAGDLAMTLRAEP